MTLCKVTGTIVATQKNEHLKSQKILIVQPINLDGNILPTSRDFLALDSVDAGVGDIVLVIQEGQGAAQVLKNSKIPVHSVIVAVVDGLDVP
ncbi:MAG TPA: EutN/CcmL family microcompartment protein [Bacteroidota bacterium]|nr:EutN/CcmL family microcompartment protein [Bacteroidota bacterium]